MEGLGALLESMGPGSMHASMSFAVVVAFERYVFSEWGGAYLYKTNQAFVLFFFLRI